MHTPTSASIAPAPWRLGTALLALACCLTGLPAQAAEVTGAGAVMPAPLYSAWADAYEKATTDRINYESIGSGGGTRQIIAKSIDFGASDMPLSPAELNKDGLIQFPTNLGAIVPIVNLPGIKAGELKLSGPVLAEIYLGRITKWDDSRIKDINAGLSLPDMAVAVVRRFDGSGASFLFTSFLSKTHTEWQQRVGFGTTVQWPLGLRGKGDEGVTTFVQRLPGAIGFVDYRYALEKKLAYTQLKNKSGTFVLPSEASIKAAAATANWAQSALGEVLTNQAAPEAWPIVGASFVFMHTKQGKADRGRTILKYFDWSYRNGRQVATQLNYVPLPESTIVLVNNAWQKFTDADGKPLGLNL